MRSISAAVSAIWDSEIGAPVGTAYSNAPQP
jgi:hypothetical protein